MPWSPTRAFPHPLANVQNTSTDPRIANYLSYGLVQALTWQGLADVINNFRKTLDLQPLPTTEAPFIAETLKIPFTYCWSPGLVPKPRDWADHIDVSGFIFRSPPSYEPPTELADFLRNGTTPVYIGFGSIVVENPEALLATILTAVRRAKVRAIVSKGWSELTSQDVSEDILFLGDCPHEWLFQHVAAVIHHGGAGTTACGLLNGRPTAIIPFFGDQPFWGERVAAAGAGPAPISHKQLTAPKLAEAITFCLTPSAVEAAQLIADSMRTENGLQAAAASFYRQLSAKALRCDLVPSLPAVYEVAVSNSKTIKVSASAAETLLKHEKIKSKQLGLYASKSIDVENRRWDPFTSAASSSIKMSYDMVSAMNEVWYAPYRVRKEAEAKSRAKALTGTEDPGEGSSAGVTGGVAAKMVGASAFSIPRLSGTMLKAAAVDTPFAITEGFRNAPKLYGEHVPDHEPITDWKSGAVVGGKEFYKGLRDGLSGLFMQPYRGAKEDGARGAVTGIGKGIMGVPMKIGAGGLGLWSYPAQGLWRTVYDATHGSTKKEIFRARRVHDLYWTKRDREEEVKVLSAFDALMKDEAQSARRSKNEQDR